VPINPGTVDYFTVAYVGLCAFGSHAYETTNKVIFHFYTVPYIVATLQYSI